jgi:ligand-binding sensor domain-containing protein
MREVKTHKFFLLLTFLISEFSLSFGQPELMFNHLTIDDGLTTNNVRVFRQDYQGFMWIGTENGLHRYDGYDFKIYASDDADTTSIRGNFIMSLFEDSERRLWVGTLEAGLSLYDRGKDIFYNFEHDPKDSTSILGNSISSIYETPEGELWLGIEQGGLSYIDLKKFNPEKPVFSSIYLPKVLLDAGNIGITSLWPKDDGHLLISLHGAGILLFNRQDGSFEEVLTEPEYDLSEFDNRITGIYQDSKDRFWLSSWGSGLYLLFPDEKKLLHYRNEDGNANSIPNNLIPSMIEDEEGNFWVGTDKGLCRMDDFQERYPRGKFTIYVNDPFNENSLKTNAVKPLYIDSQKRLWVGTYFGGANIFDPDYFRFKTIRSHPLQNNSLPGNNVTAIHEDRHGNLWIGTDDDGLCKLPNGVGNLDKYKYETIALKNSITNTYEQKIKSLDIDRKGTIWIGTWGGGLFSYDPATKESKHYKYNRPGALPSESVLCIASDFDDHLWIGTFSGGLVCLNTKTNEYSYYRNSWRDSTTLGNDKVNTLLIDDKNRLWVGTEGGGLNLFDRASQGFKRIDIGNLTPGLSIISLYQCHDGYIWVGTHSKGLFRLDPEKGAVDQYTTKFGISGNLVQSITEDEDHYLWIGTENGLSKFVFSQNSVTNFSPEEGLQSRQFNPNCVYLCSDGMLMFGGINGLNAFYPRNIRKSEFIPELVFTNFWLDNLETSNKRQGSPLKENIITAQEIDLGHHQNSFSIEYASLEFDFSKRSKYIAYLEGFDDDWQRRDTERKVTYTNLNPGKYTLHVKVINKDSFISGHDKTLNITIHPAWYQTKIFLILFFALIAGATYRGVQLRINFFRKQSSKLERKVALRTNELNEKTNEILAQNEELQAQNDHIMEQREELESARDQLTKINSNLEELVKRRTRKLEKTVAELDRFVYSASHDLSAPLKSVLGLLNIAKIDKETSRMGDYLQYMEDSIRRLEDVIKNLITYSRNSRMAVKLEEVHLHDLIKEIIDELAFLPGSEKVRFNFNISKDCILITDKQRLKIVLHNLISNSIKYADHTKPESTVDIEYDHQHTKHLIVVRDNGIGIEEEMLPKVFSMFFRATERSNGSGLGLFIVKETLGVLKGKISVTSVVDHETTFAVILPSNQA